MARSLWWNRWSSATEELVDLWWRSSRSSHCRWPRGYYSACAAYVFYEDWIEKNIALKEQNCSLSLSRKNKVRAYDLGIPSLDSEVPVNIFTQDVQKRWSLLFFFKTVTMCFQLRVVRLILPEAASTLSQVMLSQNQHQSPSSLWFMIWITKYSFEASISRFKHGRIKKCSPPWSQRCSVEMQKYRFPSDFLFKVMSLLLDTMFLDAIQITQTWMLL